MIDKFYEWVLYIALPIGGFMAKWLSDKAVRGKAENDYVRDTVVLNGELVDMNNRTLVRVSELQGLLMEIRDEGEKLKMELSTLRSDLETERASVVVLKEENEKLKERIRELEERIGVK